MNHMTDIRELILALKQVRDERGLNVDQITEIVEKADPKNAPSRSSIARVFAKGSEDDASHFRFEATLKPIYNALLDVESNEEDDSPEDVAYKSLLRYKRDLISDYANQLREVKEELRDVKEKERDRYNKKLDKETDNFHKSMSFDKEQINLKDERIDKLMAEIDKLTETIQGVVETNNKLVQQLMNCPLKE